jgi:hypothetical protein
MAATKETEGGEEVLLPGGYADEGGRIHREAEIAPLDGVGEALLVDAPPDACAARLTTLVLARSLRRIGTIRKITPTLVRDLLVEDRDYLMIRLRAGTLGPAMWVALDCPHADCGNTMEFKLMLDQFAVGRRPVAAPRFALDLDPPVEFRLPVGGDQEWAASSGISDPAALRNGMLARCLGRDVGAVAALGEAACDAIESRMEELAPDVTPELDAECPECRLPFTARLDLPFLVLRELKAHSYRLEQEVHLLAWNYKWSEREILSLPRLKRERYVRLVEKELEERSA